ncbi:MAG: hypothetical protein M1347_07265 [Chloroflexi bacterium]|nr:hypothetical protein [Chloroflexota bacterium]
MRRPFRRFRYTRRAPWDRPWKPRGPLLPGRTLNPRVQRELRRANHLMAVGEHLNAAELFLDVAQRARDIGIVYPAPMLFMQAAHAYLLGDAYAQSLEQARVGLDLLADQERWSVLQSEGGKYIGELKAAGQEDQAHKLSAWLNESLEDRNLGEATSQGQLPEKCPYCGASMSLEALNARGGRAAECQYCGSVVLPRNEE